MSSMHSRRLWVYSLQGASPKNGEHNETRQRRHGALLTSPKQIGRAGFCSSPVSTRNTELSPRLCHPMQAIVHS